MRALKRTNKDSFAFNKKEKKGKKTYLTLFCIVVISKYIFFLFSCKYEIIFIDVINFIKLFFYHFITFSKKKLKYFNNAFNLISGICLTDNMSTVSKKKYKNGV